MPQVLIQIFTPKLHPYDYEDTDSVHMLKEKVSNNTGIDINKINFICDGRILFENNTMGEQGIKAGDIIHLVTNLQVG